MDKEELSIAEDTSNPENASVDIFWCIHRKPNILASIQCVDNNIVSPVTTVVCRVSWRRLPLADAGGTIPRQRL